MRPPELEESRSVASLRVMLSIEAASGSFRLVDTEQFAAPSELARAWRATNGAGRPTEGALVLARRGGIRTTLRAAVRRVRRGRAGRLPIGGVEAALPLASFATVQRLYFEDGEAPAEFHADPARGGTGVALLCVADPLEQRPLWREIRERIDDPPGPIVIHDLQLRERGAAVVLAGPPERARWAVRIVTDPPAQPLVERNHAALIALHEWLAPDSSVRARVPTPLFAFEHGGARVYGETVTPGALAWRLAGGGLSGRIRDESLAFLAALRRETSERAQLTPERTRALFAVDREALVRAGELVSADVRAGLKREMDGAEAGLVGTALELHASHGDFGYGNVLVDPTSGALTSVIDWDTFRAVDLPGIDRVNFEIQRRRIENRETFSQAVASVWRDALAHAALQTAGPDGPATARMLFGSAVSRYVIRYLSYPEIYRREAPEFERSFRLLPGTR